VSSRAQLVRERKESGRLPLRMVKEQDLGHLDSEPTPARCQMIPMSC
jgi:hypothetical protein